MRVPILVVPSREDELIPLRHGRKLLESAREPKAFLEITGDHNNGFLTSGTLYEEGLQKFLTEYLSKSGYADAD